ncbi:MAG: hypothetical protein ACRD2B_18570 [Terriglobia bacterium]
MSMLAKGMMLISVLVIGVAGFVPELRAASQVGANGHNASVVVTVVTAKKHQPVTLSEGDVLVFQRHQRRPVVSWVRAAGRAAPLDLAILVDDSLGPGFPNQIRDLRDFVRSLPVSARVAVIYSTHGNANFLQQFTANHGQAARAFRLPLGRANEVSSIYMALTDLANHWPPDPGRRRAILLVSDGIDLYRGIAESEPGNNPDLDQAIRAVLMHHTTVYTIYASGAGSAHRNLFLLNNGQSCESLLALETGGQSFFEGFQTPISFSPYLRQLHDLLSSQYTLTFTALPAKKPEREALRVTTEVPNINIIAPREVWVR